MTATVWRTRKNSIICLHLSLVFQDVHLSKEEFLTHRLSPASGSAGGAPAPSIFLQAITSSNSIIHPKPKLQTSNQIGPVEISCEEVCLIWPGCQVQQPSAATSVPQLLCAIVRVLTQAYTELEMEFQEYSRVFHHQDKFSTGFTAWDTSPCLYDNLLKPRPM